MNNNLSGVLVFLSLFVPPAPAAIPTTELYPFPRDELSALRATTKAEWAPNTKELDEAWRLYGELEGAWKSDAPRPKKETLDRLDMLKARLEALPKPAWFSEALSSGEATQVHAHLADKIGDETFEKQRCTPEYQALKALAIIYIAEHELDRPDAVRNAATYFSVLALTHPWDWQIHALYSRLLVDAKLTEPGWMAARESIFLNPAPNVSDLVFFAFIGSIAAREKWPEIQEAMRQAAQDDKVAELAIVEAAKFYGTNAKVTEVPPKTP